MTTTETITAVQNALPQLEAEIKRLTNAEVKLSAEKSGDNYIKITSEDLTPQLDNIAKSIFKKMNIKIWINTNSEKFLNMSPAIEYTHWSGGSNGTDYLYHSILFDLETGKFIFDEDYKIQNS